MHETPLRRRAFLSSSAALALGAAAIPRAASADDGGGAFSYEITRTDDEWKAMLSEEEYKILRRGSTELPNTSPLVNETAQGIYCCKGCDLTVYESVWKVPLEIGWVFFSHSLPNSVLTDVDGRPPQGMGDDPEIPAMIEVHCRRCGSHLGHVVVAEQKLVHCINGSALQFRRARA